MFKNILILLLLFLLIGLTSNNSVSAGFFKKHKAAQKQTKVKDVPKAEKNVRVAVIYASLCPGCKNIQPTLDLLEKELGDKTELIYFDVSTPKNALASAKKAKELMLSEFYTANKSKTSTVGIIVPKTGEIVNLFQNNNNIEDYKNAIQDALTKAKALENPPA